MIATLGTPSERQASVERAIASACAAFLGADAGIGAGGIDDRQHGNAEAIGHLHQPDGLAIAFGARHAEIMLDAAVGGGALFLADHADRLAAEAAEAAHQRLVLAELAVAGHRREFGDQRVDEIGEMRALRMARHQRLLPRRQIGVEVGQRLRAPCPRCARSRRRCRCRTPPARAVRRPWPLVRRLVFRSRDSCASDPASRQYREQRALRRSGFDSLKESTHLQ